MGAGSSDGDGLKSTIMFEQMQQMMSSAGDEIVRKVKAVYLWDITKDGKKVSQWSKHRLSHVWICYPCPL